MPTARSTSSTTRTAASLRSSARPQRRGLQQVCALYGEARESVSQRVDQRVDAEGVARTREMIEVLAALAFALERVAEVGVVRHHHEDVAGAIGDRARVRLGAVAAALRRPPSTLIPVANRRNLRQLVDVVEHVEQLVIERDVEQRIVG